MATQTKETGQSLNFFQRSWLRTTLPAKKAIMARTEDSLGKQEIFAESHSPKVRTALLENPKIHPDVQGRFAEHFAYCAFDFVVEEKRGWIEVEELSKSVSQMQLLTKNRNITQNTAKRIAEEVMRLYDDMKDVVSERRVEATALAVAGKSNKHISIDPLNKILAGLDQIGQNLVLNPSVQDQNLKEQLRSKFDTK